MSKATFQDPMFHNEDKAREALEAVRWPDGAICPHCGNSDQEKLAKVAGAKHSHRPGSCGFGFMRTKAPMRRLVESSCSFPAMAAIPGARMFWLFPNLSVSLPPIHHHFLRP
jgi:hypothetical protein